MKDKRIVVALGRNAFGETFPEQKKNVKTAAEAIADLVEQKYQVVITHPNGLLRWARIQTATIMNSPVWTAATPWLLCLCSVWCYEPGLYRI
ncbi:MAG: hypothetical protein ACLSG9_05725 [Eubacterium sp.]